MQCKARSKRSGVQCKRSAIAGGTVCRMHGGGAPQVQAKAAERLKALQPMAVTVLEEQLQSANERLRFDAALEVLDRTGVGKQSKVENTTIRRWSDFSREELQALVEDAEEQFGPDFASKAECEKTHTR